MSTSDDLFTGSLVGLCLGPILFFRGFRTLRRRRLLENTPTSKTRSIAMGLVEIVGEAVPTGETLQSPFSDHECVYYRYEIEEYRRTGKRHAWVTVMQRSLGVPFFLQDDTGRVLIDPTGAEVDIPQDAQFRSGTGEDPPAPIQAFLAQQGIAFEGFLGINKTMRYTEYYVAPHDPLYILGTAGDNPHVTEGTATQGVADVMIQRGNRGDLYYISDRSEKECVARMSRAFLWNVYGGAALTLVCLGYVLSRMHYF